MGYNALSKSGLRQYQYRRNTTRLSALHAGMAAVLAAMAVLTWTALTVDYSSWELEFSRWLQGFSLGPADFLRDGLFWMGVRGVAGAMMLAVCVILWSRRWRLEAVFVALVFIPDALNILVKELIARPRPTADLVDVVVGWGGIQGSSFPSGHAVHAALFYGFLLYLARLYVPNAALVKAATAMGVAYILATGPWLISAGRHWLIDVIGGYAYRAFYLLAMIACYNWVLERVRDGNHPRLLGLLHPSVRRAGEGEESRETA